MPLSVAPAAMYEDKMYAVHVARHDGRHLTVDDYQWVKRCLGLRDDESVSDDATDIPSPLYKPDPGKGGEWVRATVRDLLDAMPNNAAAVRHATLDDAVYEINRRWGEELGDDLLPMNQALVRETAEAVLAPLWGLVLRGGGPCA